MCFLNFIESFLRVRVYKILLETLKESLVFLKIGKCGNSRKSQNAAELSSALVYRDPGDFVMYALTILWMECKKYHWNKMLGQC